VTLQAGEQVIRLSFAGGTNDLFNLNSISLQRSDAGAQAATFEAPAAASFMADGGAGPDWMVDEQPVAFSSMLKRAQKPIEFGDVEFLGNRSNGEIVDTFAKLKKFDSDFNALENQLYARDDYAEDSAPASSFFRDDDDMAHFRRGDGDFLV